MGVDRVRAGFYQAPARGRVHQSIRDVLGVGADFSYEVLSHEDWVGRRLVAERFRQGNVFIAGDAAHLWVPYAGYGMNAGIADGVSLAWLMTAVINGWAPEAILDAYEAERLPITDQVSRLAIGKVMENAAAYGAAALDPLLEADTPQGQASRERVGAGLHAINMAQFAPARLNFGYFYDASPIIAYDGSKPPLYDMGNVTPSTVPGCRMPHFWLPDGRSVYDLLAADYTLLRFDESVPVQPLLNAATHHGMPLRLLDVARPPALDVFADALLIVRHDQHIAWRGAALPERLDTLIDRLSGRLPRA